MIAWERIRRRLLEAVSGDADERSLAAGFAVGVFFRFTPLLTLRMVLALLVAFGFRFNRMTTMAGEWVNNPYTIPFVFYGCFHPGETVPGMPVSPPSFESYALATVLQAARPCAAPRFLGTAIMGLVAAAAGYLVVYRIAAKVQSARRKGTI